MSEEEEKKEEVSKETTALVALKIKKWFHGLKEGMLGSMDTGVEQIATGLKTINEIMRPGLRNIAHSLNKPYVEPTIETDFLEMWNELENKEEVFEKVAQKYKEMLHSIPDRNHWRL